MIPPLKASKLGTKLYNERALQIELQGSFIVAGGGIYTHFLTRNKRKEKAIKGNTTTCFSDGYKYAVLIGCFPLIS